MSRPLRTVFTVPLFALITGLALAGACASPAAGTSDDAATSSATATETETATTSTSTTSTSTTTGASASASTSADATSTAVTSAVTGASTGTGASGTSVTSGADASATAGTTGAPFSPCPADMVLVGEACVDVHEAPNVPGELPLVMYTFDEAASWCAARGKRLCLDREWTAACEGPEGWSYPYGDRHVPGLCRDDALWLPYNQTLLNGWPWGLETDAFETLAALLEAATAHSLAGAQAADHVAALYQAHPAGEHEGCVGPAGVLDLTGNVEEWTRREDGGADGFHGNLKGRYWADTRTCQDNITSHGDGFRFYEIGFRCCVDPVAP